MGRRSRRSNHRKDSGWAWKLLLLVLLPLLSLGGGGYGISVYMSIETIGKDYCYDRLHRAESAVFLDYSVNRNLTAAQRRDVVIALTRAYDSLSPNGRVMIFTTAKDTGSSLAKPVYQQCRPPENATEQAAIGAPSKSAPNLSHIAFGARSAFLAKIDEVMAETRDEAKSALESPLLSQLQAISRYRGFQGEERSLIWLSDGIENSEIARFGAVKGDMPKAEKFMERPDIDLIRPDPLRGMNVTVLLVESISLPQPGLEFVTHDEMRRWWPEYFRLNGAGTVRLERLRRVTGS